MINFRIIAIYIFFFITDGCVSRQILRSHDHELGQLDTHTSNYLTTHDRKLTTSGTQRGMPGPEHLLERVKERTGQISDKFDGVTHTYYTMYGIFLDGYIRHRHSIGSSVKMLEIGLGCDMIYGPGISARTWRHLYPNPTKMEIWFAEYDADCVNKPSVQDELKSLHIQAVTGDQGNITTLHDWVDITGGMFDIVIDDGGHQNKQILNSFNILFYDALAPGGLYFIEDLQVGRDYASWFPDGAPVIADVISSWINQLLIKAANPTYPIPKGINWIMCQSESCVIAKCLENDVARCS